MPWHKDGDEGGQPSEGGVRCEAKVMVTQDIREWDYGEYEGLTSKQVCRFFFLFPSCFFVFISWSFFWGGL